MTAHDTPTATYGGPAPDLLGVLSRGDSLGRYVVLEEIGAGGMGVVYAAYDPELDRQVALKVLPTTSRHGDEARLRLLREAQALAKVVHPNVVSVHDVGSVGGQVFLAMELVRGEDLAAWLTREERPWRRVIEVFVEAGRGLSAVHEAGLAHRDFKPANARLGDDGRVRVLDFGLAQGTTDLPLSRPRERGPGDEGRPRERGPGGEGSADDPGDSSSLLHRALTREGRVFGTPRYMAPEQHQGLRADARSDQFSFCVALWEALYGAHPFDDPKEPGADPVAALAAGPVDPSIEAKAIPGTVQQALRRGLSFDPEDRHPSLDHLLDRLDRARRPRTGRFWAAAVVGLGAALLLLFRGDPPCAGAETRLEGVWDDARRTEVQRAFQRAADNADAEVGTDLDPDAVWRAARERLDAYAASWRELYGDVCRATHVRKEQSEELLDLRMGCLEERRRELGALVDVFADADAPVLRLAEDASTRLSSLRSCSDLRRLTLPVRIEDPALESEVAEVRGDLATVRALSAAGRFERGLELAERAAERAELTGYAPVDAEAHLELGALRYRSSQPGPAWEAYSRARYSADAGRHDVVRAEALHGLMWLAADGYAPAEEAEQLRAESRAVIERLDDHAELLMRRRQADARLLRREGRLAEASAAMESAVALSEELYGADHPTTASMVATLGTIDAQGGRFRAAATSFERALDARRRSLGDRHPDVGSVRQQLANVFLQLGRYDDAVTHLEESLRLAGERPTPHKARVLADLGYAEVRTGRGEPGLAHIRQALDLWRELRGEESLQVAETLNYLGDSHLERGDFEAAEERLERAVELYGDGPASWPARLNLQRAWIGLGRLERARKSLDQVRAAVPPGHYLADWVDLVDGEWLAAAGRPAEAVARFQHVKDRLEGSPEANPYDLAAVRRKLANALLRSGRPHEAREQARAALDAYTRLGPAGRDGREALEQWLSIHGSSPQSPSSAGETP